MILVLEFRLIPKESIQQILHTIFSLIMTLKLTALFFVSILPFTLAQCEFVGRYYAGGVSELTPNEFRSLVVPYRHIQESDITKLKEMFNENEPLDVIVNFVNSKTIGIDVPSAEIVSLDSIRKRLIKRRK